MKGRWFGFRREVRAVWRKELRDAARDRRSLLSTLLYPILMPLMFGATFGVVARLEGPDRPLEVPVAGREHAPNLVAWLEERGVAIVEPPADPEAAVRDGGVDFVLVMDEEYGAQFRAVRPAVVRIIHDSSRTGSRSDLGRTRRLLREYASQVGALRLMARGVHPGVIQALRIDDLDVATPAQSAARFFGVLPMFLIVAAFVGGLNVAIDTTAGERERRSLEPLLVNPASRSAVAVGKWLATCVFGLVAAVLTLVLSLLMMRFVPLEQLGVQLSLGGRQLLLMALAVAPIALLASALQMFVATFARSFKEAQTYVSLLLLLPMLPSLVAAVYPLQAAAWMMMVPALSQHLLLVDIMGGEPVGALALTASVAGTLLLTAAFLAWIARMLQREKIVFGRV